MLFRKSISADKKSSAESKRVASIKALIKDLDFSQLKTLEEYVDQNHHGLPLRLLDAEDQQTIVNNFRQEQHSIYTKLYDQAYTVFSSVFHTTNANFFVFDDLENAFLQYAILIKDPSYKALRAEMAVDGHAKFIFNLNTRSLEIHYKNLTDEQVEEFEYSYKNRYGDVLRREGNKVFFNISYLFDKIIKDMLMNSAFQTSLKDARLSRKYAGLWNNTDNALVNVTRLFTPKKSPSSASTLFVSVEEKEAKKIAIDMKEASEVKVFGDLRKLQADSSLSRETCEKVSFALRNLAHLEPLYIRVQNFRRGLTHSPS